MADSAWAAGRASAFPADSEAPRHALFVRATHWIAALCFLALLLTGFEIVVSHPRFYWGETGNVLTPPLFKIPIASSRATVPTGYGYVLPDQNGWSRALHFQSAWILVLAGLVYLVFGSAGHFRKNLLPGKADASLRALGTIIGNHLRFRRLDEEQASSYNALQKLTYLSVIFFLTPLVIWTGLAMSPGFVAAVPATVRLLGGQQSARTIHFFVSLALLLFLVVHVVMVWRAGFTKRMRAMITGSAAHREAR
ncbi:MAG: cytochrome b/b6 domain-containing protein [Acidobacteriia bacterium]|nr:cytochrome b/b6 domain-containing protein [Terriglobia bacterium]